MHVFNGKEQTFALTEDADFTAYYTVSDRTMTNAGSKIVTASLKNANYAWNEVGSPTANKTFTFTIANRAVILPTLSVATAVYPVQAGTFFLQEDAASAAYYNYPLGDLAKSDVGAYSVTITLKDKENTHWGAEETDVADKVIAFSITPLLVKAPLAAAAAYVYDGASKTFALTEDADFTQYYEVSGRTRTDAGTQTVTVALKNANYAWNETGYPTANKTFDFTISKRSVAVPTLTSVSAVYTGSTLTFALTPDEANSPYYAYSEDDLKKTNVGAYVVEIHLVSSANTYWGEDETDVQNKSFDFVVTPLLVTAPKATSAIYTFNGEAQTFALRESPTFATGYYTISDRTMTNAGEKTVTVRLNNQNYAWNETGYPTADKTFTFTILPKPIAKPTPIAKQYFCTGAEQTFALASGEGYEIKNNVRSAAGEYKVTVSLLGSNYVWADETTADLSFDFVISHKYSQRKASAEYLVATASCEHGDVYRYACVCGAASPDLTYENTEALGHDYEVTFVWDETAHTAVANVVCHRDSAHNKTIPAEVTLDQIAPGVAQGYNVYTATVRLDRVYTSELREIIPAIGFDYSEPEWTWVTTADGYDVTATFSCVTPGYESVKEVRIPEGFTLREESGTTYSYNVSVVFNGVEYADKKIMTKPRLTFDLNGGASNYSLRIDPVYVMPNTNVTDLFPSVPVKSGAAFLKWQSDNGVSVLWSNGSYTTFVIGRNDVEFRAVWVSHGTLTVSVKDIAGDAFTDCTVYVKQSGEVIATSGVNQQGVVSFDGLEYGNYTVVVEYSVENQVIYTTGTILVNAGAEVSVTFSTKRFNTELVDNGVNVSVENLENAVSAEEKQIIVTTAKEGDVTEIKVRLEVNEEVDAVSAEELRAFVEDKTDEEKKVVRYTDVTLVKTVVAIDANGQESSDTVDLAASEDFIEICFAVSEDIYQALADVHGTVENLLVARRSVTDGTSSVEYLSKRLSKEEAANSNEDCYYIIEDAEKGVPLIVVHTKNFDNTTYGLCVSQDSVLAENDITLIVTNWTYGETPVLPTVTAKHGTPVVKYRRVLGEGEYGEWLSVLPTDAGSYVVTAYVEADEEYARVETLADLVIAKATIDVSGLSLKDLVADYDGDVHSIVLEGDLPAGILEVRYEGNAQVDVGTYTVTVRFVVGENYEAIADMTAVLTIRAEEDASKRNLWLFWTLLGVGAAELLGIGFFLIAKRRKKKGDDEVKGAACVASLYALTKGAYLAVLLSLAAVDLALLILIIVMIVKEKKKKKAKE